MPVACRPGKVPLQPASRVGSVRSGEPFGLWPRLPGFAPSADRRGVLRVVAVGVEAQALPEARTLELALGNGFEVANQVGMNLVHLFEHLRQRKMFLGFRSSGVERIDAA